MNELLNSGVLGSMAVLWFLAMRAGLTQNYNPQGNEIEDELNNTPQSAMLRLYLHFLMSPCSAHLRNNHVVKNFWDVSLSYYGDDLTNDMEE